MKNSSSPSTTGNRRPANPHGSPAGQPENHRHVSSRAGSAMLVLLLAVAALMAVPALANAASTYTVEDCGSLGNTHAFGFWESDNGFVDSTSGCGGGTTGLALAPNGKTTNMALGDRAMWAFTAPSGEKITGLGTLGGNYHSNDGWISGWAVNGRVLDDPLPASQDCTKQDQMHSCSTKSSGWVSVPDGNSVQVMIRCDNSSTSTSTYCKNNPSYVGVDIATAVVQLTDPSSPALSVNGTLWNAATGSGLTNGWVSGINSGSGLYMNFSASNPAGICRLEAVLDNSDGKTVDSLTERSWSPRTDATVGSKLGTSAPFNSGLPCGAAATGTASFAPDLSQLPTGVYYLNVEAKDPSQYQRGGATYTTGTSLAAGYPIAIDNSVPTVAISTGTISGDWYTGPRTITVTADDAAGSSGLKSLTCADQGTTRTYALSGDHENVSITLSTDGQDTVDCHATSAAGNSSSVASATVNIDSQLPELTLSNGPSQVSWYRTAQRLDASATAVGGADLQAIDCTIDSSTTAYPATGTTTGESVQISVPAPGGSLVCQALDTAGNRSAKVTWTFRIDDTPPTGWFEPHDPGNPTLVSAHVADTGSGVHTAQIQIRTSGGWRSLPTTLDHATGIASAHVPDNGSIPNGTYAVRALVTDIAGNSADVASNGSGRPEGVTLPLRGLTRLRATVAAGRRHVAAASVGGGHVLRLPHGASVRIAGVLATQTGVPVAHAAIRIVQMVADRAAVRTVGRARTNGAGHFVFTAPAGPSRRLEVLYEGSRLLRAASTRSSVRVRGLVRLRVPRIIHAGRRTTIHGRVLGGYIPAGGALVQLWYTVAGRQVGWEPFERAIRTRHDGAFRITFRVPGAARNLTYRFKAVVAAQSGWPYLATISGVQTRWFR